MNLFLQAALITIPVCYVIFRIDKAREKRHKAYNPPMNHDQREGTYD